VAALANLPSTPSAVTVTPVPASVLTAVKAGSAGEDKAKNTKTDETVAATDSEMPINTDDIFEGRKADKYSSNTDGKSLTETKKSVPQDTVGWAKRFNAWLKKLPTPVLVLGATVIALLLILLILFVFHCVLECTARRKEHKYGVPQRKKSEIDGADDPLVSAAPTTPYVKHYQQPADTSASLAAASASAAYVSSRTSNKMTQSDEEFAKYLASSTEAGAASTAPVKRVLSAREKLLQDHLDLELGEGDDAIVATPPTTIQANLAKDDHILFDSSDTAPHSSQVKPRPYVDDDIADDSDMFT